MQSDEDQQITERTFSRFSIFISVWLTYVSFLAIVFLYRIFFRSFNFYKEWSFTWSDKPWVPPSAPDPSPLIGGHFFGDFLLPISYLQTKFPYDLNLPLTLGIAPVASAVLKFFTIFGTRVGYLAVVLVSLAVLVAAMLKWMGSKNLSLKISLVLVSICFSFPIGLSIDRGNLILLAVPLLLYSFVKLQDRDLSTVAKITVIAFLTISVSFKSYLLLVLILYLPLIKVFQNRKLIYWTIYSLIISNSILSFFFSSNPIEVMKNIYKYSSFQSGEGQPDWLLGGIGPMRSLLNLTIKNCTSTQVECVTPYQHFANLPALIWFLIVFFLIRKSQISYDKKTILVLTSISAFPPVSMGYTLLWVPFALLISINMWIEKGRPREMFLWIVPLIILNLPNTFTGLLPWPFQDWRAIAFLMYASLPLSAVVENYLEKRRRSGDELLLRKR